MLKGSPLNGSRLEVQLQQSAAGRLETRLLRKFTCRRHRPTLEAWTLQAKLRWCSSSRRTADHQFIYGFYPNAPPTYGLKRDGSRQQSSPDTWRSRSSMRFPSLSVNANKVGLGLSQLQFGFWGWRRLHHLSRHEEILKQKEPSVSPSLQLKAPVQITQTRTKKKSWSFVFLVL